MDVNKSLLDAAFNHLVLPPKIPNQSDGQDTACLIRYLEMRLQQACGDLRAVGDASAWDILDASLRATFAIDQDSLSRDDILHGLASLTRDDAVHWLILKISGQNAALIIHNDHETRSVVFEAFRTAAPSSTVLEANHALSWDFPDRAVAIPMETFRNESFLENLCRFLEQGSSEAFDRFAVRAQKGGKSVVETRDCPSPALVTDMLMSLLEALGHPVEVRAIHKKVRDEIVLGTSEGPWRRLPYWLILRVAVNRLFTSIFEADEPGVDKAYYKFLMVSLMSRVLQDSVGMLHPEKTLMLQAKICRRLAKLETERTAASGHLRAVYDVFFAATSPTLESLLADARSRITAAWENYKRQNLRIIPRLPRRAADDDLVLQLPNSREPLNRLMFQKLEAPQRHTSLALPPLGEETVSQVTKLANQYAELIDYETRITDIPDQAWESAEQKCTERSAAILHYLSKVDDKYADDAVFMSLHILRLFEMWVDMDQAVTSACPLLLKYHPVLVPRALDVLCLTTTKEMSRLMHVQKYLSSRISSHRKSYGTIFDKPNTSLAFPMQFVHHTPQGSPMLALAEHIDAASHSAKLQKAGELANLTKEYKDLTREIESGTCVCTRNPDGTKNVRGCRRCWKWRCRARLRITTHEDFLPTPDRENSQAHRAAILFEILMPRYLRAYRMATWKLRILGNQIPSSGHRAPAAKLSDFEPLIRFWASGPGQERNKQSLGLSSISKFFSRTHYQKAKLPTTASEIMLPFGAELSYYDTDSGFWAENLAAVPWFEHLLGSWVPQGVRNPYADPDTDSTHDVYGPSSYEIAADECKCPAGMSSHEFSAFQRVVSGRGRRWLVLLVELGATNINFSSDTAMALLNHLAIQAGPAVKESGTLREAHVVFSDDSFCRRLHDQISRRLDGLVSSWRESYCMSIMITFTLRLYNLCTGRLRHLAKDLLSRIRGITCSWIAHLRDEVRSACDASVAQKAASYAFWAALLCRQTFVVFNGGSGTGNLPTGDDLLCFFRASIAMQENLLINLKDLSAPVKRLLIQDLSMSYIMRMDISEWLQNHQTDLEEAINETWTDIGASVKRSFSPWASLPQPNNWWVVSKVAATRFSGRQIVHYHLLQGHLLVDGKPLGRLPLEMREDPGIQELFGHQHLLTRPSALASMEYQLVNDVQNHQIHFGHRDGKVLIRARYMGSLLEFVPRDIFKGPSEVDLPSALIDDCVHWLNLNTGMVEMRRAPAVWRQKHSNWVLDTRRSLAVRNKGKPSRGRNPRFGTHPGSYLIEPRSKLGMQVASIFRDFEEPHRLTIFQSATSKAPLSVEMKRLEITFVVNDRNLLSCRQLRSEVDPQQNSGTLHGLASGVVLRSVKNFGRKSIIVPMGKFAYEPRGMHVVVRIFNDGKYARFSIDPLLGRLVCPPEPALLYLKAALHASTSFPLPDSLTGRTGTEEALHCLSSARAQPWKPLYPLAVHFLNILHDLSPQRQYYPPGKLLYQNVAWNDSLTMTIQHEALAVSVRDILQQSQKLETFSLAQDAPRAVAMQDAGMSKLAIRGAIRRQIYERITSSSDSEILDNAVGVTSYRPTEGHYTMKESCQVYRTVLALQANDAGVPQLPPLAPLLHRWGMIGGFDGNPDVLNVGDLLEAEVSLSWGSFVQACRQGQFPSNYDTLFKLAVLAFNEKADMSILYWLITIAKNDSLQNIEPPPHALFTDFKLNEQPDEDTLAALLSCEQPNYGIYRNVARSRPATRKGALPNRNQYEEGLREEGRKIAVHLTKKWPVAIRSLEDLQYVTDELEISFVDLATAWGFLEPEIQRLSRNADLSNYVVQLTKAAKCISQEVQDGKVSRVQIWTLRPTFRAESSPTKLHNSYRVPQLAGDLASKPYALPHQHSRVATQDDGPAVPISTDDSRAIVNEGLPSSELTALHELAEELVSSSNATRKQYGTDLLDSFKALVQEYNTSKNLNAVPQRTDIKNAIASVREVLHEHFQTILGSLSIGLRDSRWLFAGNLWPCVAPIAILELLRESNGHGLGWGMKEALVRYGLHLTTLQRLLRMLDAQLCYDNKRLHDEQQHEGHSNWDPLDHPEWLLLEIDNDLLIRKVQIDVARAIIAPSSGQNSVLQMNMGQGKTSCIVPMAVIALADKESLCRLVVPRALLLQTAQVIQSRLGGLVGRIVRHIPFARRSPSGAEHLDRYHQIHRDTLELGGVMLCLPENILSFKLSGLQRLVDYKLSTGRRMVEIQRWLDQSCRDIIDESDFTLSVKTQLIYPSGPQTVVDGHPYRWQVIQELLSLVDGHASGLKSKFPSGIEVVQRHQGYPILHFLQDKVEDRLNTLLVRDICAGRLPQLQLKNPDSEAARSTVWQIVSGADIKPKTWASAAKSLTDPDIGLKTLYLLRGVISHRIVLLCLKKRWNVQYGLHPRRAPIAVPFEAKGIPSQTAEYGHPDTALILTCLAFYQTGLTKQQIRQSLLHVLRSDDPAAHYDHWVHGCEHLPAHFRHWNLLNADDEAQVAELWKYLRFDRNVLNHYMNNFVFPAHAKQFGVKLQASGWDIPLFSRDPKSRQLTTGFSGTNDNKRMLPQSIKQDDLPSLLQTNAEVLSYLLEPRNQRCYHAIDRANRHLSEDGLLKLLQANRIKVLIDAGAHILEMENAALASAWLAVDGDAKGAVYFSENNQIMVQARFQKRPMPLLASPFADALEDCVVYIDEAHTRGTDLKLPVSAKGALTLGLNQTKDQTVQAAMRLRQLGSTQSIAFVAPPEVYRSIVDLRPNTFQDKTNAPVTSTDVVRWLLEQSCKANENMMSLHVAQGLDFCRRTNAMWKNANCLTNKVDRASLLDVIRQKEDQTLEQLYGPRAATTGPATKPPRCDYPSLQGFMENLQRQKTALYQSGRAAHSTAFEEVEQEREVEFEVEQVREKQRPVQLTALTFPGLDPFIVRFVESGILNLQGPFVQAFKFLGTTKIGKKFGVKETASKLFVSREFTRTIAVDGSKTEQGVVRPVEWILWSVAETALIVTPEEAELLLPKLRASKNRPLARLHSYAAPVTKSMRAFNTLSYLTVPSMRQDSGACPVWLSIELGVLARRLYFDYVEYEPLLAWLGVSEDNDSGRESGKNKENGNGAGGHDLGGLGIAQPLAFLLEWLNHGRQTHDIMHTPMGYVCQRRELVETHPFFVSVADAADADVISGGLIAGVNSEGGVDDSQAESDEDSEWEPEGGIVDAFGSGGQEDSVREAPESVDGGDLEGTTETDDGIE